MPANETSKDDTVRDAERSGEVYELGVFFAVSGKNEDDFWIFGEGEGGAAEKVLETFLGGKTPNGTNDVVAGFFGVVDVLVE